MIPSIPTHLAKTVYESKENLRRPFFSPVPDEPGHWLIVLDNTSLSLIKRCHKAGYFFLIAGRQAHAKDSSLVFGGALHDALEIFHKWQAAGSPEGELETVTSLGNAAILKYFESNPTPLDDYRTPTSCIEVFRRYITRAQLPGYEWQILSDEHGPIVERAFELPLFSIEGDWTFIYKGETINAKRISIAWSGRIDALTRVHELNRIMDNKTSSIDTDQFRQGFLFSSQTIGYAWAAKKMWPDIPIKGFCLNGIYFKNPKGKGIYDVGPRGGAGPLRFGRDYYNYSDVRIARWERDTCLLIEDFLHSFARGHFPLNDSGCFDKFGQCQYFDACAFDLESVGDTYAHSANFKEVTWNPTT